MYIIIDCVFTSSDVGGSKGGGIHRGGCLVLANKYNMGPMILITGEILLVA